MRLRKNNKIPSLIGNREIICSPIMLDTSAYDCVIVEVGAGKGKFISTLALNNPQTLYVAFESVIDISYKILLKKEELNLKNLIIVNDNAVNILNYLTPNTIDKIYLNFSDPWEKKKQHKRRLTFGTFLDLYKILLKDNGILEFRTDHEDLFNDSIEYITNSSFVIEKIDRNFIDNINFTEYEERKRELKNINFLKASVKK
jgi:tRNA (guanine-N7-)-methyltransferase